MGFHVKSSLLSLSNYFWLVFLPQYVVGPNPVGYCEFGYCETEDQYCCGKDKCCRKTSDIWYFWIGITLIVATIVIVTSVKYFLRKMEKSRTIANHYEPVPNQIVEET